MSISDLRRSSTVREKRQLTLPPETRSAPHVTEGDEVEFVITEDNQVVLRSHTKVPTDQRWFWDHQWWIGERQASNQIATGRVRTFSDADDMFDALADSTLRRQPSS